MKLKKTLFITPLLLMAITTAHAKQDRFEELCPKPRNIQTFILHSSQPPYTIGARLYGYNEDKYWFESQMYNDCGSCHYSVTQLNLEETMYKNHTLSCAYDGYLDSKKLDSPIVLKNDHIAL